MSGVPCRLQAGNCPVSVTFAGNCITVTQAGNWTEKQKKAVLRYLAAEGFMEERSDARFKFEREDASG